MATSFLSPESAHLIFLCGLGWPEVSRYYLSQRRRGLWEFWEQGPTSRQARLIFAWMTDDEPTEHQVARRLLRDYLGTFRASTWPAGEIVQGLLSFEEIERLLSRHVERRDSVVLRFPLQPDPPDSTAA